MFRLGLREVDNRAALRLLRRGRRGRANLSVRLTDEAGNRVKMKRRDC